ncbi:MAG TPA: trimethylamine methyltransferase family protein [Acidobacteriota bacterium]|nr:trimethylamine methyltransferase family protein [Acidobacteriota bacterium]
MSAPEIPIETAERIHRASLELLRDPGVRLEHDEIFQLALSRGARAGCGAQVVRIPEEMVREALDLCPKPISLCDKSGRPAVLSAEGESCFWSVPGMSILRGGTHRPFTSGDMADIARLLDQLENVSVIFGMSMEDIPPPARDVVGLKIMALNSRKHLRVLCFTAAGAAALKCMKPVVGDYPWFSIGFTAHGPLRWTQVALDIFKNTAGAGIPATINGEPMAGTSAPITLAGAAAVGNAEILAGIVVNQLLEPGRPCIYNLGLAHVFDMRTAIAVTGAPENALLATASAIMGRYYRLPSASWVSTESMVPDSQAALENMFAFHTHLSSGVSCIWGIGQLESELTICPAQAVIDDEMISYIRRFQQGFPVDSDSLALEIVREVGIGGSFLQAEHTLSRCRTEFFLPSISCRVRRGRWAKEGAKRMDEKAEETASRLIKTPVENGLSPEQQAELERITDAFLSQPAKS